MRERARVVQRSRIKDPRTPGANPSKLPMRYPAATRMWVVGPAGSWTQKTRRRCHSRASNDGSTQGGADPHAVESYESKRVPDLKCRIVVLSTTEWR